MVNRRHGKKTLAAMLKLADQVEEWRELIPFKEAKCYSDNYNPTVLRGEYFKCAAGTVTAATKMEIGYNGTFDAYRIRRIVNGDIRDEFISFGDKVHFNGVVGMSYARTADDRQLQELIDKALETAI